jgi:hypothetical protein
LRVEGGAGRRNYLIPSGRARRGAARYEGLIRISVGFFVGSRITPNILGNPTINVVIVVKIDVPGKAAATLEPIKLGGAAGLNDCVEWVARVCKVMGITKVRVHREPVEHVVLTGRTSDGLLGTGRCGV